MEEGSSFLNPEPFHRFVNVRKCVRNGVNPPSCVVVMGERVGFGYA